jgi:hypothetical protein
MDCVRIFKEIDAEMPKNEIIFFDELGFGWVVDRQVLKMIYSNCDQREMIVEKTLADLLRRT